MTPFQTVTGAAIPLGLANVDTDVIIAAEHLKTLTRAGLGGHAFGSLRADPSNLFEQPRYKGAPILIAGANFGCGSSREHAAWAIADLGIRAVIAPSFSDIFAGNAFKNGIAAVVLEPDAVDQLLALAAEHDLTVDLQSLEVRSANLRFGFRMDPFRRHCLLHGLDEIGLTLSSEPAIAAYEQRVGV